MGTTIILCWTYVLAFGSVLPINIHSLHLGSIAPEAEKDNTYIAFWFTEGFFFFLGGGSGFFTTLLGLIAVIYLGTKHTGI